MSIIGMGIDIVNIGKMRAEITNNPNFIKDVFTAAEGESCEAYFDPSERYSSRFAAKESFYKALPQWIQNKVGWFDVEIRVGSNGKPEIFPAEKCKSLLKQIGVKRIFLSIAHESGLAIACVILSS
jgi:holo-[acyl-carrier protein] synthase